MKKRPVLLLLLFCGVLALGLAGCNGDLTLSDVQKQNRNKWHVTYDLQGGVFSGQANVTISHYYPKTDNGTYICEPGGEGPLSTMEISKAGYFLEGWYPTKECVYADKWDFKTKKIEGDTVLYAKWLQNYEYRFMYRETPDGEWKALSSREVSKGGKLSDSQKPTREGHTMLEWYSDESCQTVWNLDTTHTGKVENGESVGRVVDVYTTWIEGDYAVVKTASEFTAALSGNRDIYLYNDIKFDALDPNSDVATNWNAFYAEYGKTIEGNNHTVSGIVMAFPESGVVDNYRPTKCAMVSKLLSTAVLKDITFKDVTLTVSPDDITWRKSCALLAAEIEKGATFQNVTITGTFRLTHKKTLIRDEFGLVAAWLQEGASLDGIDYLGVEFIYECTAPENEYSYTIDEQTGILEFTSKAQAA